ncbi:MAG: hypothetical protein EOO22_11475 [Comamonadaceae bacterium]|nr:MAG: hypothetical protein EOO22_11475 [Comamonadaceae bacterium]
MHSAPSVSFPVGRSRDAGRLLLAIWIAGAATVVVSGFVMGSFGWRSALPAACGLFAGALAYGAHRRSGDGCLHFDGHGWNLTGVRSVPTAHVSPALDLQSLMLVRMTVAGRHARWLWLERRSDPARWLALRRAVYSRAPSADPAEPAAAMRPAAGSIPSSS